MSFDRRRLLANIAALTKEKGVRIGDLETAARVSTGYFSRLNKEENSSIPNIEVVAAVSERLGVTIDSLVNVDYSVLSSSERYLIDFIDKLLSKTQSNEILWDEDTVAKMNGSGVDQYGDPIHPLFTINNEYASPEYQSLFHEWECVSVIASAFHVVLEAGSTLWLVQVEIGDPESEPTTIGFEFYLQKGHEIIPICSSVQNSTSVFTKVLYSLYNAAAASSKVPRIDPSLKSVIDNFMDDLPF